MSDRTQQLLNRVISIVTLLGVLFAIAKTAILIPRDIEDLKASDASMRGDIREMRDLKRVDHDLLQRIDERMRLMQEKVNQIDQKIDRAK